MGGFKGSLYILVCKERCITGASHYTTSSQGTGSKVPDPCAFQRACPYSAQRLSQAVAGSFSKLLDYSTRAVCVLYSTVSYFYQRFAATGILVRSLSRIAFFLQAERQTPQP